MNDRLILDRYRPISEAGSGGYGTVTLAWDTRIQRRVAIKVMPLETSNVGYDAATVPGLEEARTAAMLNDPNIVGVLDFEVRDTEAYLIMEYIDGSTLTSVLRDYGDDIDMDIVAAVFDGIAGALRTAHGNQVLHLDVKPDNVIIDRQGRVKVTDFGLSKLSDAGGFGRASGGTIGYMPPEQIQLEALDARCDEWALAAVVYEMITGSNPFLTDSLDTAVAAITDTELVIPSLCMEDAGFELDDVLFRALDPDRENRYPTVAAFADELDPLLGDAAVGTRRLAEIVGDACDDETVVDDTEPAPTPLERWMGPSGSAILRAVSAAGCFVVSFFSLSHIDATGGVTGAIFWGVVALIVLAAVLVPHLGTFLAFCSLGAALILGGNTATGVVVIAATALWWFFVGRRDRMSALCADAPGLFGAVVLGSATPLLCGYLQSVGRAVATAAYAWLMAGALGLLGSVARVEGALRWFVDWRPFGRFGDAIASQSSLIDLAQDAGTWITLLCWLAAAALMSLFCRKRSRVLAALGALVSGAVVVGGGLVSSWISSGMTSWTLDMGTVGFLAGGAAIVFVLCCLGVPERTTYDD